MAIPHCYCHLLVKNGNFTLLLTSSGQERQFHTSTDMLWSRMAISHCFWHLVGNCFHFATDRLHDYIHFTMFHLQLHFWCSEAQAISAISPKTCTLKLQLLHNHKMTNKVVWTCKYDWSPQRTSTYKRPFTQEGNYLVHSFVLFSNFTWALLLELNPNSWEIS